MRPCVEADDSDNRSPYDNQSIKNRLVWAEIMLVKLDPIDNKLAMGGVTDLFYASPAEMNDLTVSAEEYLPAIGSDTEA